MRAALRTIPRQRSRRLQPRRRWPSRKPPDGRCGTAAGTHRGPARSPGRIRERPSGQSSADCARVGLECHRSSAARPAARDSWSVDVEPRPAGQAHESEAHPHRRVNRCGAVPPSSGGGGGALLWAASVMPAGPQPLSAEGGSQTCIMPPGRQQAGKEAQRHESWVIRKPSLCAVPHP